MAGFLLSSASAKANPSYIDPVVINSSSDDFPISASAEFLTIENSVSAEEIASSDFEQSWQPYSGSGVRRNGGATEIWLRFAIDDQSSQDDSWYLLLSWAMLEHSQLSIYNNNTKEWWHSRPIGNGKSMSDRYIKHRYLLFPLFLNSAEKSTYYLNIKSTNLLSVPISVRKSENLLEQGYADMIVLGLVFGSLLIMLLYNFSLLILLRDRSYFYYCVYVSTVIFYLVTVSGVGQLYFWDSNTWIKTNGFLLSSVLTILFANIFGRQFLNLPSHGGWLLWLNSFTIGLWILIGVVGILGEARLVVGVVNILSLASCIFGIGTSSYLWYKQYPAAKMFTIAWAALILSTMVFILALEGVLPMNKFTSNSQMLGFIIELVLLSAALAHRIKHEIEARERAKSEALALTKKVSEERKERLKAQNESIDLQRELNEELEFYVAERTEQLNDAMIQLEAANEALTRLSITDPLTKVHNRRYFDDTLIDEYKRALRTQQMLAVIVVDIDHFKNINDNYGHTVGDSCIALVASTLKDVINRPGDIVARYGGEEFVYILPGSDEENALVVAENCRLAIQNLEFTVEGNHIPMTISAGVAAWVPTVEGAYKQLINTADTALYHAKSSGRNYVKTAQERGKLAQAEIG